MRLLTSLLPPSDQRGAEASHGSPPLHRGQTAIGTRAVQPKASKLSEWLLEISGTITALGNVTAVQQFAATSSLDGTYSTQNGLVSAQPVRCEEGWVMSSYARYCQDQATACARRARLVSSSEIVAYCRNLELRWLRLAEQAHGTGGALDHESGLTATSFPLHDKPAAYPTEYAKRAGELIARSALSLHRLRQKKKSRSVSAAALSEQFVR